MTDLQQSEHWEERKGVFGNYDPEYWKMEYPGFPFNEPWPRWYRGKLFEILTYRGRRLQAIVDDSRQYRAEGLEWRTRSGPVGKHLVIAWRELPEEEIND